MKDGILHFNQIEGFISRIFLQRFHLCHPREDLRIQQFILSTYQFRVILPWTREAGCKSTTKRSLIYNLVKLSPLGRRIQQVIVNTAYRTLSDDDQRTAYDAWRRFGGFGCQQVHAYPVRFGLRADVLNHFEGVGPGIRCFLLSISTFRYLAYTCHGTQGSFLDSDILSWFLVSTLCHMKGTPLADINSILEDDTRIATFQPVLQIGFWDYLGWGRQEEM